LRWPVRAQLTEGEIAAEHGQPGVAECIGQRHEKRRAAVCPGSMCQDEAGSSRMDRLV
jgi:hypothetical protein